MRRSSLHLSESQLSVRHDWSTLKKLFPYLWRYKWRVMFALSFLLVAKGANVWVPVILKDIIDYLTLMLNTPSKVWILPVGLLVAYGLLRISVTLFTELREWMFAKVMQRTVRMVALEVFRHVHGLSLRFHLNRQTGGMTRDIERGTRGISSLISYTLFSILPTLVEIFLVTGYLWIHYDRVFVWITLGALVLYIIFTVMVTEWRTHFRRKMNELDSRAHTSAIDSLINYETVKYFGNEKYETDRYDMGLQQLELAALKSQKSLSFLNLGQSLIIAIAATLVLWRATYGVVNGVMTVGDLVLVNAFMIQLYIPLGFLGVMYREIKQSLTDMERLFSLLEKHQEIGDKKNAYVLQIKEAKIEFSYVNFSYEADRQILFNVNFVMEPGTTTAVVGHSGSGKSTLSKLLFRFYDVQEGCIKIDNQDIRDVTQNSLRNQIGIVPQDTVLFNESIEYNIAYGKPGATHEEVIAAAKVACIHDFIMSLPQGYATSVGERGLKLSGGEKQRVAIARTVLKAPAILVFDEATSALDSRSEQAIQTQLNEIAQNRTTLIIAHRLSTILHAHQILVLDQGRIVECGRHEELIRQGGLYFQMWQRQEAAQKKIVLVEEGGA